MKKLVLSVCCKLHADSTNFLWVSNNAKLLYME